MLSNLIWYTKYPIYCLLESSFKIHKSVSHDCVWLMCCAWCVQEVAGLKEEDLSSDTGSSQTTDFSSPLSESQYTHMVVLLVAPCADCHATTSTQRLTMSTRRLTMSMWWCDLRCNVSKRRPLLVLLVLCWCCSQGQALSKTDPIVDRKEVYNLYLVLS